MKLYSILLLFLIASCAPLTSCQTKGTDDEGASQGISGSQTGYTREKVYEWQDKTFRQLAY